MSKIMSITRDNCRIFLAAFIEDYSLSVRQIAKVITCTEATLNRIIVGKTLPSDEMLRQTGIMIELGFKSYSKLSKAEKEKISEAIGTVAGGTLGFGVITAVVSSLGLTEEEINIVESSTNHGTSQNSICRLILLLNFIPVFFIFMQKGWS